ncbi:PIN domain-containing protein [Altericista sp. CCNU0014]|uniref:PIN domain-containing protein n=1 Tax=Altericista sp. CCNU0014 TaxID=3082949 RepID=UPI003850020B
MAKAYRIYLDVCCLNRPFDDWAQPRIRLEAEAVIAILNRCQTGDWLMVASTALASEIAQTPEVIRRQQVIDLLAAAKIEIQVTPEHIKRSFALQRLGFKPFDALHIACAEAAKGDVFITTDDRLLRKAATHADRLDVQVQNPLTWLMETTTELEGENNDDPS